MFWVNGEGHMKPLMGTAPAESRSKRNEGKLLMSDDSSNNEIRIYFCDFVNGQEIKEYTQLPLLRFMD
jgi:hypothetical protein